MCAPAGISTCHLDVCRLKPGVHGMTAYSCSHFVRFVQTVCDTWAMKYDSAAFYSNVLPISIWLHLHALARRIHTSC